MWIRRAGRPVPENGGPFPYSNRFPVFHGAANLGEGQHFGTLMHLPTRPHARRSATASQCRAPWAAIRISPNPTPGRTHPAVPSSDAHEASRPAPGAFPSRSFRFRQHASLAPVRFPRSSRLGGMLLNVLRSPRSCCDLPVLCCPGHPLRWPIRAPCPCGAVEAASQRAH
jgi:hypothetical protein